MIDEIGRLRMDFIFENNKYPNRLIVNIDTGFKILKETRLIDVRHNELIKKIVTARNIVMMRKELASARLYGMGVVVDDTVAKPILEKV